MKGFLFIILVVFIVCQPKSFLDCSKEEQIEREKMMKQRLIDCINKYGSEELKEFVKKNEDDLKRALGYNANSFSKADKAVIRDCRQKIIEERHEEMKKGNDMNQNVFMYNTGS